MFQPRLWVRLFFEFGIAKYVKIWYTGGDEPRDQADGAGITDTFAYDTYGKMTSRTGTTPIIFGYNGLYGVVTDANGLLYMRARYYSPVMRRFVNADIVAGDVSNSITLNRYAFADANPVLKVDPLGLFSLKDWWNEKAKPWLNENIVDPVKNFVEEKIVEPIKNFVEEKIVEPVKTFVENVKEDIENFDTSNTDEQKVLDSHYFSAYKGKLVIRTNMDRSGSLGILFISHKEDNRSDRINTIKHEYGHTKQLDQMGLIKYLLYIGLPSWQEWGSESYYRKPWEITADIFGEVNLNSRTSDDPLTQAHIDNGNQYLAIANSDQPIWKKIEELKKFY